MTIVAYPLQMPSLTTLAALSIGMLLTPAPLVGLVFLLAVWAAACRYSVEVFERSTNGSMVAPEFAVEPDGMGWSLLILQALFLVCRLWLDFRISNTGLRWIGISLISCLQPAMILTAAMNRDLGSALDPGCLLRVVSRLGLSYVLLIAATFVLGTVQLSIVTENVLSPLRIMLGMLLLFAGSELAYWLTFIVGQLIAGFFWFYVMVMYFHVLGRLVFTHRKEFDFTPIPDSVLRPEDRHAPLLKRVDRMVEDEDFAGAAFALERCLSTEPHASPAMHARYRELMARIGDHAALLTHARTRLDALLVAGSEREALGLLRESLASDLQFRPSSGERTTQLAQVAERLGQPDLALSLLRDYSMRYPRDEAIPTNALTAARLLVERHSDVAGASAIMQAAIDRMLPAHPMYLEMLDKRNQLDQLIRRLPGVSSSSAQRNS